MNANRPLRSAQPFSETFQSLRKVLGLSEREVTALAARHGATVTHSAMSRVYTGEAPALPHHIQAISAALGIDPDTFVEHRLWKVVHLFDIAGDERRHLEPISWDLAYQNLLRFEELSRRAGRGAKPFQE